MPAKPTYAELEQKVAQLGSGVAELERAEELVETRYSNPEWKKNR